MTNPRLKRIASFLVIVLVFNFIIFGFAGSTSVEAGLWDNPKEGLFTVLKGLVMLWIINLISNNSSAESSEDFLTSTIKNGLNLFNDDKTDKVEITDDDKTDNVEKTDENNIEKQPVDKNGEIIDNQVEVDTQVIIEDLVTVQEQQLVDLVNEARLQQGLHPLKIDMKLVRVARKKADDMVTHNYFAHQSPTYGSPFDMLKAGGISYALAGENLAAADSVGKAFTDLMNSTAHRENILDSRFDKIGIGIIEGGPHKLMIVQEFIDLPNISK